MIEDVVAFGVLHGQECGLDIRRIDVHPRVMDRGEVTVPGQENLSVVERLAADPVEQGEPVPTLVEIREADPFALPRAAAVLMNDGVTVGVILPQFFQHFGRVGGGRVGGADDDHGEPSFRFRQLQPRVKADAVREFEHIFPDDVFFHEPFLLSMVVTPLLYPDIRDFTNARGRKNSI